MQNTISREDREFVLEAIRRNHWTWAKTMPSIPHEYIVRNRCALNNDEFDKFVILQRNHGIYQKWGRYNFPYLHIDGYKYWTMGAPVNETIIVNRQKLFDEYNVIAPYYDSFFDEEIYRNEDDELSDMLSGFLVGNTLEIGSGTGKLIELISIPPTYYTGVEPAQKMSEMFVSKFPEFKNRLICKAFEECTFKNNFDSVVSLYGSISYIMRSYIPQIESMCKKYFLMFYAPEYEPVTYQKAGVAMHHFQYYPSDIQEMLPGAKIVPYHNYLIARKE